MKINYKPNLPFNSLTDSLSKAISNFILDLALYIILVSSELSLLSSLSSEELSESDSSLDSFNLNDLFLIFELVFNLVDEFNEGRALLFFKCVCVCGG